ncbi:MAG TPA: hypothetical protein VLD37_05080 [Candidatus Bilamarchaeum sp.]|nr:hypothetical protein [Candidatus Bilamarchaeum sp.]
MEQKKKGLPAANKPAGFRGEPLAEEGAGLHEKLKRSSTPQELIAECAAERDAAAIPALVRIAAESGDEELAEAAREAVLSFGMDAAGSLARIEAESPHPQHKSCARELAAEVSYLHYSARAKAGDVSAVGQIVGLFSDVSTGYELAERVRGIVIDEMGLAAVPELIRIADAHDEPAFQDCAIVMISDIAAGNPGNPELLEAVPMLCRKIRALEDIGVDREIIEGIRSGGNPAGRSLLLLRAVHPAFSVVSNALELLRELWEQNPGNRGIEEAAYAALGKIGTKDPVLNDLVYRTIREICGIAPPLIKTDKIEN